MWKEISPYFKEKTILFVITCIFILFCMKISYADNIVTVKASISRMPKCEVIHSGGSGSLIVDLGDIHDALIDGNNYKKKVDYRIICSQLEKNDLKMILSWDAVIIGGKSVVRTDVHDLGIAVYNNNILAKNNEQISFDYNSPPSIYVVPVKNAGAVFSNDASFRSSTILMTIDYS